MLGLKWMEVKLCPHDGAWDEEFKRTKAEIMKVWTDNVVDIQHVGSTSIREILAKPIIDAAVVVKSFKEMDVNALVRAGYCYMGARNEAADRYMFAKYATGSNEIVTHHIHIYEPDNLDYRNLIGFRDRLNNDPEAAKEYNEIKIRAAEKYSENRYGYSDEKRNFIERIIQEINHGDMQDK